MTRTVRKKICATALVSVFASSLCLSAAQQPVKAEKTAVVPSPGQKPAGKVPAPLNAPVKAPAAAPLATPPATTAPQVKKLDDKSKDTDKKAAATEKKGSSKVLTGRGRSGGGSHFVPPPPPNTPTMMSDGDYSLYSGMPVEMLSKEALKDRAKELSIQYKDSSRELEDRSREKDEKVQRAKEFEALFQEGVVSRRELEASQRDAGTVNNDIDRLTLKTSELKSLLDRINKRLIPRAAKKTAHKLIN